MGKKPSHTLIETFENPNPDRNYTVGIEIPEFTCLCPLTGQPDFATLIIEYIPDQLCIELKSLKNYIGSFRDRKAFHEAVSNEIIDHLFITTEPRYMELEARFHVRGGISTTIGIVHKKETDDHNEPDGNNTLIVSRSKSLS